MNWRLIGFAAVLCGISVPSNTAYAVGPVVIGPGPHSLLYVTQDIDYHVLDGTEIISPSRTGPPEDFVVVTDAIEFRGGGHIRIDGGYFRGGDASYTGNNGDLATVSAGEALHLRQSSGEIYGGTFIGGESRSTTWLWSTTGGDGLVLVESDITIYDGYFEGGISTEPEYPGSGYVIHQAPGIIAYSGSTVLMHGGQVNGDILIQGGATLSVFGFDLQYEGSLLSGRYTDGTSFTHTVPRLGGVVLLNTTVPEPSSGALFLGAICVAFRRIGSRTPAHG